MYVFFLKKIKEYIHEIIIIKIKRLNILNKKKKVALPQWDKPIVNIRRCLAAGNITKCWTICGINSIFICAIDIIFISYCWAVTAPVAVAIT